MSVEDRKDKICPLCGARVLWFPISRHYCCESCHNTFNEFTSFPEPRKVEPVGNMETSLILRIGRDFQNSDKFRGCTFDTAKLLCDEIERLSRELESERSKGNCAKLREAVASLIRTVNNFVVQVDFCGINPHVRLRYDQNKAILLQELRKADAALAEPARNCDVGTADEQRRRYDEWRNHDGLRAAFGKDELDWAQLPYESDGKGVSTEN